MNVGLIFGVVFTLILIGFVLIFGGQGIMNLMNISGETKIYSDISTLEKEVSNLYSMSENSAKTITVHAENDVKVCFVDPDRADITENGWVADGKYDFIAQHSRYNVFIIKKDGFDGKTIKHLKPRHNFCIISRKTLTVINKGRYVDIESGA